MPASRPGRAVGGAAGGGGRTLVPVKRFDLLTTSSWSCAGCADLAGADASVKVTATGPRGQESGRRAGEWIELVGRQSGGRASRCLRRRGCWSALPTRGWGMTITEAAPRDAGRRHPHRRALRRRGGRRDGILVDSPSRSAWPRSRAGRPRGTPTPRWRRTRPRRPADVGGHCGRHAGSLVHEAEVRTSEALTSPSSHSRPHPVIPGPRTT